MCAEYFMVGLTFVGSSPVMFQRGLTGEPIISKSYSKPNDNLGN